MGFRWDRQEFRQTANVRNIPDIRRGMLYPLTVISQYSTAKKMLRLFLELERLMDPHRDIEEFRAEVFDPRTAVGWGLDCWGQIVGISRTIDLEGTEDAFGFAGSGLLPWNQAPFWSKQASTRYTLTDEAYRRLIFFKAAINITDGTLASLNWLMQRIFGHLGGVWILRVGTMKLRMYFDFYMAPNERALAMKQDVLPKPAGVGIEIYELPSDSTFGFAGSGLQPWGQGTFQMRGPQDVSSE